MASTSRSGRGLLCIAGAIGLGILSLLLPYVWDIFLPASGFGDAGSFYYTVHTVWIPLSGLVLRGAAAALFVIGFLLAWRDRTYADSGRRPVLGLATMAFAVSAGAAGILTVLGITAGLVYSPDFDVPNCILNVGLSIAIGLSLYWLLLGGGGRQAPPPGNGAVVAGCGRSGLAMVRRAARAD